MVINVQNGNTLLTSGSFPPARVASTGSPLNPSTGGLLTVDGITLVAGDRVLCKDETSAINNGIYAASTGPWVRTSDANSNQHFFSGMNVTVALGTVNAGNTFRCTCTDDPVVVGTSLLTWSAAPPVGGGNVVGPASSTTGHIAQFADATGKLLQDLAVTGTGSAVFATSPTLVTPTLGAATATTINKITITQPAASATLTIANTKTLTANNSITVAGTDGKTLTVSNSLTLAGTDGKTLTVSNSLALAGTDGTTMTMPASNDTLVGLAATQTLTNKTLTLPVISTITNTGTLTLPTSTDTLVGRATTDTLTNKTLTSPTISGGTIDNAVIGGTTPAAGTFTTLLAGNLAQYTIKATGVNFNSANTDTSIAVSLPPGVTNYQIASVRLANASASISTATFGLFSAAAGGGTAIIANNAFAITVTSASANTNNNSQTVTPTNSATQSWNFANLFFRVGTAQGSAATADVIITIVPLY